MLPVSYTHLIHVVDAAGTEGRDPIADIRAIMKELEAYDPKLLEKPQVIAANKMDAVYGDENEIVQSLRPVSYTHLDVYKRQAEERDKRGG